MATPIATKVQQLINNNFDLGAQVTNEIDAGYGGKMQDFEKATIYWFSGMGDSAYEVHGAIRNKYLSLGAHNVHPTTGERAFGFPLNDEENSDDARCRVSRFEFGSVYWIFGGVAVFGKIYEEYAKLGLETGKLGYPIADPVTVNGGLASFFEHGILYFGDKSQGQIIDIRYNFPQLGHPWLIPQSSFSSKDVVHFTFFQSLINNDIAGQLFEELFNGRIFLKETGGTIEVPISFDFTQTHDSAISSTIKRLYSSPMNVDGILKNQRLYDIILKLPVRRIHAIGAHSVYIKDSWNDFQFIHLSDTHVSRRLDNFRRFFRDKSMDDAVRNFNNFNDNFREFIQYANKLHRLGGLDFIMLTGDLVDYCFEDGGKIYYHNNFVFFENIVRGLTGKPDQVENEELRVPLLTSLGNHDYRVHAYYPLFTVNVPGPWNLEMEQYSTMNLTKDEAEIITRDHLGIKDMISKDRSYSMIAPDRENRGGNLNHYFRHVCREPSYSIRLGDHEVVMINGKWDDGPIDSDSETIKYLLGFYGESTENFHSGSPDSVGFNSVDLFLVNHALQRDGLVIVGVHAPVFNPKFTEYPWFLREYIRTANPAPFANEMRKYLFRMEPAHFATRAISQFQFEVNLMQNVHSGWSRTNSFWFSEGNGSDLLDFSVMRGKQGDFLKICTGVMDNTRPVDLILAGHVHKNWECRIIWEQAQNIFRFSHEFFTENPTVYYHSYDTDVKPDGPFIVNGIVAAYEHVLENLVKNKQIKIHVEVTDAAAIDEIPVQGSSNVWSIKTKPYPYTLNAQSNKALCRQWWQNIRPLFVQTAAIGPSEWLRAPEKQPDFRGCRLITVQSDIISRINYVTNQKIKDELSGGSFGNEHIPISDHGGVVID